MAISRRRPKKGHSAKIKKLRSANKKLQKNKKKSRGGKTPGEVIWKSFFD